MDVIQETEEFLKNYKKADLEQEQDDAFNDFLHRMLETELDKFADTEKTKLLNINALIIGNKFKRKDIFDVLKVVPSQIAYPILIKLQIDNKKYAYLYNELMDLYYKDFVKNMDKPLQPRLCKKFTTKSRPFTYDELTSVCASKNINIVKINDIETSNDFVEAVKSAKAVLKKVNRQDKDYEFMQANTVKYLDWIYAEFEKLAEDKKELDT